MVAAELTLFRCGLCELIRRALPAAELIAAEDLTTACQLLEADPTDVLIADMDGLGPEARLLLRQLCLDLPSLRVMVLVGPGGDRAAALGWLEVGAHACLPKVASPEELCEALRIIRSGNGFVSAGLLAAGAASVATPRPASEAVPLTSRQQEVLRLLAEGRPSTDIARRLGVSVSTVKAHLAAAYRSLGAHNRVEALVRSRGD
jgi:DNA-binding NarL/FixJ family response regulator